MPPINHSTHKEKSALFYKPNHITEDVKFASVVQMAQKSN